MDRLECSMTVEGRLTKVRGHLRDDGWVECESRSYTYEQPVATLDVNLFLTAGGSFVIDKTTGKCGALRLESANLIVIVFLYSDALQVPVAARRLFAMSRVGSHVSMLLVRRRVQFSRILPHWIGARQRDGRQHLRPPCHRIGMQCSFYSARLTNELCDSFIV